MRSESTSAFGQPRLTKPTRGFLLATRHFTGRISGMRFTKMHGLGNDFIIFDAPPGGAPSAADIRRLADRFTGIGFDQALMLEPPRKPGTAVFYRIFNADGREVEQCGNGARCIARHVVERAVQAACRDRAGQPRRPGAGEAEGRAGLGDDGRPGFRPGVAALRGERRSLRLPARRSARARSRSARSRSATRTP